jgi:hypothetical protein
MSSKKQDIKSPYSILVYRLWMIVLIESCKEKLFGGHDVADEIIEYNFYEGIKRMQQNLHLFDNITFVDGNSNFGEIIAIYIKKSNKHEITNHTYSWFNEYFEEAFSKLKSNTDAQLE